jgi:hypothetical protein
MEHPPYEDRRSFRRFGAVSAGLSVLFPAVNYAFQFVPMTDGYRTSAPGFLTVIATVASLFIYLLALSRQTDVEAKRERRRRIEAVMTFLAGLTATLYVYYLDRAEQIARTIAPTPAEQELDDQLFWMLPALYTASFSAFTRAFCLIAVPSSSRQLQQAGDGAR